MDPVTQGALGAVLPQSLKNSSVTRSQLFTTTWLGALTGMSPDLDVLIQSSTDPLLFLEFHRQFTHSLIFIPMGALICSLVFYRFAKSTFTFKQVYLVCFLAYSTHALLDACTTYGTQLFWPFTDARISWNYVSVIDPLVTVPLLAMVAATYLKTKPIYARIGLGWVLIYLGFGVLQNHRVEAIGSALATSRGHQPTHLSAKPGFANLVLWKVIYEFDGYYYVDAIQAGFSTKIYEGSRIEKLDKARTFPWLDKDSQQAKDLDRFDWFSQGYLAVDAIDSSARRVIDIRYSMLPNEIKGLWSIELDPNASDDKHVLYKTNREASKENLRTYWQMILGE